MTVERAETFRCDLCDESWLRAEYASIELLRARVADHLWVTHAIRRADSGDMLPMTAEEIAWVRAQRR